MSPSYSNVRNASVVLTDTLPIRWPFYMAFFLVLGLVGITLQILLEAPIMAPMMAILLLGALWMIRHESQRKERTDFNLLDGLLKFPWVERLCLFVTLFFFVVVSGMESTEVTQAVYVLISILTTTALCVYVSMRIGQYHVSRRSIFYVRHLLPATPVRPEHLQDLKKILFAYKEPIFLPTKQENALIVFDGWVHLLKYVHYRDNDMPFLVLTSGMCTITPEEQTKIMPFLGLYVLGETLKLPLGTLLAQVEGKPCVLHNEDDIVRLKELYDVIGAGALTIQKQDTYHETEVYL